MNERKQIDYYEIVAKDGDEIIMLDYVFDHGDGFKGATGTRFYLISKEEYEERTSEENVRDNYGDLWRDAVQYGHYEGSKEDYIQELMEDVDTLVFDGSHSQYHDMIREKLGVSEEDYPMIDCTGGGRMFDAENKYETVYRPDLLEIIKQYETN